MKRFNNLRKRGHNVFYEGETLKIDNGNYVYLKMGDTWMSEHRSSVSAYELRGVSVAVRVELNRIVATTPDIPKYPLLA